ncbi:Daunorubicin/doxorubicin resistance ATP-binding protein DrrA [Phycisphaerae bacterium RAS2]|nr:Daunorubicin/doxorubicin resistance ATP-binding protein DrrA [Phycisphaerae bacterium RAS2]
MNRLDECGHTSLHSPNDTMAQIDVRQLGKTFRVPEREGGFQAAMRSFFRRKYKQVRAVDAVSFSVEQGEIVGFLGPNGAGKTTTLKMLSGLLHPTDGEARVLGFTPWERKTDYLRRISMLMGQRSQMQWDLPAMDSFLVHQAIYGLDPAQYKATLDELIELLELTPILKKQVRTLSLGERMKCEICVSLLHRPSVLFLDEPTIGVDITMQARIREFIRNYNRRHGATIILTSHYMADVAALCKRIIVIDHGRILFDGALADLSRKMAPYKVIKIDLERDANGYDFAAVGEVLSLESRKAIVKVPKERAAELTSRLLTDLPVQDVTIEDPPIEDVIARAFGQSKYSPAQTADSKKPTAQAVEKP